MVPGVLRASAGRSVRARSRASVAMPSQTWLHKDVRDREHRLGGDVGERSREDIGCVALGDQGESIAASAAQAQGVPAAELAANRSWGRCKARGPGRWADCRVLDGGHKDAVSVLPVRDHRRLLLQPVAPAHLAAQTLERVSPPVPSSVVADASRY